MLLLLLVRVAILNLAEKTSVALNGPRLQRGPKSSNHSNEEFLHVI
jgi:hypothetical protein